MTTSGFPASRPVSGGHRAIYLDIIKSGNGWMYVLSGSVTASGWRPTRRWAKRAGKKVMRAVAHHH